MRELTLSELEQVNGGLNLAQGETLIGGAIFFAGLIGATGAVAFGGGALLAIHLALNFD